MGRTPFHGMRCRRLSSLPPILKSSFPRSLRCTGARQNPAIGGSAGLRAAAKPSLRMRCRRMVRLSLLPPTPRAGLNRLFKVLELYQRSLSCIKLPLQGPCVVHPALVCVLLPNPLSACNGVELSSRYREGNTLKKIQTFVWNMAQAKARIWP